MKVTFLTPSVSRALGGIYEIERDLAHALQATTDTEVTVVGLEDEYTAADRETWRPFEPKALPVMGPRAFGYSPGMLSAVQTSNPDLVHLHSLWMYPSVVARRWHQRTGRPHMVTIHGMLDGWALRNASWKKKIATSLYERANLQAAACLQVNSERELAAVRSFGIDTPVCVIPNGVALPPESAPLPSPWASSIPENHRVLLFLGRIHPKKGLDELLTAWRACKKKPAVTDWSLAIVGWDDGGHAENLSKRVSAEQIPDVHLFGSMFGRQKRAAFEHADAFVLPSFSEGLPMAVLEAWSHSLPVVLTPACNLSVGKVEGAAVETQPVPDILARDLSTFCAMSATSLARMGMRGRRLVETTFTWQQVAQRLDEVYRWAAGQRGTVPDSVSL